MLRAGSVEFPVPDGYSVYVIETALYNEESRILAKLAELHQVSSSYGEMPHLGDESAAVRQSILSASTDLAAVRQALNWVALAGWAIIRIEAGDEK